MADLFFYCESCNRVSILAEVARFGVDTYPYICPGCAVEENGQVKVPAGKGELKRWSQAREEHPTFPLVPVRGHYYR